MCLKFDSPKNWWWKSSCFTVVCDGEYSGDDEFMEVVQVMNVWCEAVAAGGGIDKEDVVGDMEFELDVAAGACDAGDHHTSCGGGCVSCGSSVCCCK